MAWIWASFKAEIAHVSRRHDDVVTRERDMLKVGGLRPSSPAERRHAEQQADLLVRTRDRSIAHQPARIGDVVTLAAAKADDRLIEEHGLVDVIRRLRQSDVVD